MSGPKAEVTQVGAGFGAGAGATGQASVSLRISRSRQTIQPTGEQIGEGAGGSVCCRALLFLLPREPLGWL